MSDERNDESEDENWEDIENCPLGLGMKVASNIVR